jgi:hypothetical protein
MDAFQPCFDPTAPAVPIRKGVQKRIGNGVCIQGVNQKAIAAIGYNIPGATVCGGHNRQATGCSFNQSQAKRFG